MPNTTYSSKAPDIAQIMKKIQMDDYGVRSVSGDKKLCLEASSLVEGCQASLQGEYSFYSICLKGNQVYGLIHAFYNESSSITEYNVESVVKKDCLYLHQQLKQSTLNLDYFFVMPYFDYLDKKRGSSLYESVLTNKIEGE